MFRKRLMRISFSTLGLIAGSLAFSAETPASITAQASSHIPFVAMAGRLPLRAPSRTEVILLTDFGAIADDEIDDGAAFVRAQIEAQRRIAEQPGLCVQIALPPGKLLLSAPLFWGNPNTHLIGQGAGKSMLHFSRSLAETVRNPRDLLAKEAWAFRGGMLWVEHAPQPGVGRLSATVAITGSHSELAASLTCDPAQRALAESLIGIPISFKWLRGDTKLLNTVYGRTESTPVWNSSTWSYLDADGSFRFEQISMIERVAGDRLMLSVPLRLPVEPGWKLVAGQRSGELTGVAFKGFTVRFPVHPLEDHLKEKGFNAIFLRGVVGARIEDVAIENADNGIIIERSHFCAITKVRFHGEQRLHHAVSIRSNSNDNLIEQFTVDAPVQHGISVQDLSSGNVFSKGLMRHGTFDSHRGMPFDNVRTEITITPDGTGGGASGPFVGRRTVNWNIEIRHPADASTKARSVQRRLNCEALITGSQNYVMGALVGIRGAEPQPDAKPWALPPGDKGTIVAEWGKVPNPPNLYEAQVAWWRSASASYGVR